MTAKTSVEARIASTKPCVVIFTSKTCKPCHALVESLPAIKAALLPDEVDFLVLDIEEYAHLTSEYAVMEVPTSLLLLKGHKVGRFGGRLPVAKYVAKLRELLKTI
jgi:thioredoxin-like negative regulator of GroEL